MARCLGRCIWIRVGGRGLERQHSWLHGECSNYVDFVALTDTLSRQTIAMLYNT